jgi:hypothetical protein
MLRAAQQPNAGCRSGHAEGADSDDSQHLRMINQRLPGKQGEYNGGSASQ